MTIPITHLWLLKTPEKFQLSPGLIDRLDLPQYKRFETLSTRRKISFCLGRLLLVHAFNQEYGTNTWEIRERVDLPPIISSPLNCNIGSFSISHSRSLIGVALCCNATHSPVRLGLDIETVKSTRDLETARVFCNDQQYEELNSLASLDLKQRYLTRLWTQKEAYFKAFEQNILNPDLKLLSIFQSKNEPDRASIHSTKYDENSEISIFCGTPTKIICHQLTIDMRSDFIEVPEKSLLWHSYSAQL